MEKITFQQFLLRQPSFPEEQETDRYYYDLCCTLIEKTLSSGYLDGYHPSVAMRMCIALTGYYQDVICDSGLWHGFIDHNRCLYNKPLPFYECGDEYLDYELNLQDVMFMVWYSTSFLSENHRYTYPHSAHLKNLSKLLYEHLDAIYDEAPMPVGYVFGRELEIDDPNDAETIYKLGNWLFMNSYLLTPAFTLTLSQILSDENISNNPEDLHTLRERMDRALIEEAIGPLALYTGEWLYLTAFGKLPKKRIEKEPKEPHKYFLPFRQASNGKTIRFFDKYETLNSFFIDTFGWDKNEEHLPQIKNASDIVVMVNRNKGMLIAPNIAKCIYHNDNPLYDKEYATKHAFSLLSERGMCPPDLLKYLIETNSLPDAVFPGTEDTQIVADNADFIARCYLQLYYRGH